MKTNKFISRKPLYFYSSYHRFIHPPGIYIGLFEKPWFKRASYMLANAERFITLIEIIRVRWDISDGTAAVFWGGGVLPLECVQSNTWNSCEVPISLLLHMFCRIQVVHLYCSTDTAIAWKKCILFYKTDETSVR